jgi:DNA-directed RNA polymerase subunit RPC12/RpoP
MAMTTGYNQYVCDRCGKVLYATSTNPDAQSWRNVKRIDSNGQPDDHLLCPDCYAPYRVLISKQDGEVLDFVSNKKTDKEA